MKTKRDWGTFKLPQCIHCGQEFENINQAAYCSCKKIKTVKAQSKFYNLPHGNGFDALEVHTCRTYSDGIGNDSVDKVDHSEDVQPGDFFSLYGHTTGTGNECIGDFTTFEAARDTAEKLGCVA